MNGSSSNDWILDKNGNHQNGMWSWEEYVSPGYFATLEIPIVAGRDFNDEDTPASPKVAIVNQAFVKKFLHGAAVPIGQTFPVWNDPGKPGRYYQVVGLVKDSVYKDMHQPVVPVMYFPHAQLEAPFTYPGATFLIRSHGGMSGLLNSVKSAIAGVNSEIDIQFVVPRTQIRENAHAGRVDGHLVRILRRARRAARRNRALRADTRVRAHLALEAANNG